MRIEPTDLPPEFLEILYEVWTNGFAVGMGRSPPELEDEAKRSVDIDIACGSLAGVDLRRIRVLKRVPRKPQTNP